MLIQPSIFNAKNKERNGNIKFPQRLVDKQSKVKWLQDMLQFIGELMEGPV